MNLDEVKDYIRENMIEFYNQQTVEFLSFIFKFYQNGIICFKLFDRKFNTITSVSGLFNDFEINTEDETFIIFIGDRNKDYFSCCLPLKDLNKHGFGNVKINKEIYTIGFSYA